MRCLRPAREGNKFEFNPFLNSKSCLIRRVNGVGDGVAVVAVVAVGGGGGGGGGRWAVALAVAVG